MINIPRLQTLLLQPSMAWAQIADEKIDIRTLLMEYAAVLAAIGPVANFIGQTMIGRSMMGERITIGFGEAFIYAVLSYLFSLAVVLVGGFVIDLLGPFFGAQRGVNGSMKIIIYSFTPAWLVAIFSLVPSLWPIKILGLYTAYLVFTGIRQIKNPTPDKLVGYCAAVLIIILAATVIAGLVASAAAFDNF